MSGLRLHCCITPEGFGTTPCSGRFAPSETRFAPIEFDFEPAVDEQSTTIGSSDTRFVTVEQWKPSCGGKSELAGPRVP